ncbi:MAG: hypothetical protein WCG23_10710 [bacterium]
MIKQILNRTKKQIERTLNKFKEDNTIATPQDKIQIIIDYATDYNCSTLVETGTYLGDTTWGVKDSIQNIYSIELSEELYNTAKKRFMDYPNIHLLQGDSSDILPQLLDSINKQNIIFWLDGHYSGDITAKGKKETPILEELCAIRDYQIKNSLILIDDSRCFGNFPDYPEINELKAFVMKTWKKAKFQVKNDIIRIII